MITLARLQILQMTHGAKAVMLGALAVCPLLLTFAVLQLGGFATATDARTADISSGVYLFAVYTQFTCIVAALFYGTAILNTELDWKTLTYLFTRPVPKWQVILGKYLGILAVLVPALVASAAVTWLMLGMPFGLRGGLTVLLLVAMATATYTALFAAIGVLVPKRAIVAGLIYGALFEWALTYVPALVNKVTVTYYVRGLAMELVDPDLRAELAAEGVDVLLPATGLATGFAGPAIIAAVGLIVTCIVVRQRQYATHNEG